MSNVHKTLYIPLYGKALVSKRGLFLRDEKAEQIWDAEGFPLKGKARSKWLAYYMGIRSAVFDDWLRQQLNETPDATVVHIGCGMDSRCQRVLASNTWYDVDFPQVISARKEYFTQTDNYQMLAGDARVCSWLEQIKERSNAIVIMEGVSMYLTNAEMQNLMNCLCSHFGNLSLLVDCYTPLAAKMSKHRNPVNSVGVTTVHGVDDPSLLNGGLHFVKEHDMTPQSYINQLHGLEKFIFKKLYAGGFSKKLYRLFEYKKI